MTTRAPSDDDPITLKEACEPVYYTAAEAAAQLGKSRIWLYQWVNEHPLDAERSPRCFKVGGTKLFSADQIECIRAALVATNGRKGFGQVYFIEAGNFVKIGYTYSPISRVRRMMTDSPFELRVLHAEFGTLKWERTLHRQFASFRVRGEWFHKSAEILEFIKQRKRASGGLD